MILQRLNICARSAQMLQMLCLLIPSGSGNGAWVYMPWTACFCSLQDTCGIVSARLSALE